VDGHAEEQLRLGVGLFPTEPLPAMVELARVAERLGYGHVWIGDSHLIWREAYVTLAAAATATDRVVLGTSVTNLVTRDPAVVASAFATLHEAWPGRVILGAGLGDSAVETMGKKPSRLAAFEAELRRVRALLAGEEVATEAGTMRLAHAVGDTVPIYVAGSGPRILELAGRVADGVIVLAGVRPDRVRRALDAVRAGARAAGRAPERLDLVLWVPCALSDDERGAREAVKAHVARAVNRPLPFELDDEERRVVAEVRGTYDYSRHMDRHAAQARAVPDWLVDRFAIAGGPATCRAALDSLRRTGIRQVAIIPYGPGPDGRAATMRAFAAASRPGSAPSPS
jgi:5,10-methylenetetrahydromethanopterin reductase